MYLCAIKLHETAYNDNDIDDRTADSTARHNARLSFCVLYEGANVSATTEVATGLRYSCPYYHTCSPLLQERCSMWWSRNSSQKPPTDNTLISAPSALPLVSS